MTSLPLAQQRPLLWAGFAGTTSAVVFVAGPTGASMLVFVLVVALVMAVLGGLRTWGTRGWTLLLPLVACLWLIRSSPWILVPAFVALLMTFSMASLANGRTSFDIPWHALPDWVQSSGRRAAQGGRTLMRLAASSAPDTGTQCFRTVTGALVLTVPLIVILTLLLAWADPVFAAIISPEFSLGSVVVRPFLFAGGVAIFLMVWRIPRRAGAATPHDRPRLRRAEAITLLASVAALFLVFAATQVAASWVVGIDALADHGITVADYARQGYFQLLAVVLLTTVVLVAVDANRQHTQRSRKIERGLSLLIAILAMVILGTAVSRLLLYIDSYGLTMLRLACFPGAAWMAILLVLVAMWTLGVWRRKAWLPAMMVVSILATFGSFAAVNPEAFVVRYNTTHTEDRSPDALYLGGMSDDAVPSLIAALPTFAERDQEYLKSRLCRRQSDTLPWQTWSLSRWRAQAALHELCDATTAG
ncbi:MAG: DUF4173 domain-containing protein [Actinomycetes bacterium]